MATKQFYATGSFRYGTRRLTAGDPIELDDPNARLFLHLGKISDKKPRVSRAAAPTTAEAPIESTVRATAKTPRKRAAKKK